MQMVKNQEAEGNSVESEFDYRHLKIVAPEILEALEGRLSLDAGEVAVHMDFFKPSYPSELLDLLDWADSAIGTFTTSSGANFSRPLYLSRAGVLVFNVVKMSNIGNGGRLGKKALEDFMERERKNFFSWHGDASVPNELKLSYLMVIKNSDGNFTVALASIARPKIMRIG